MDTHSHSKSTTDPVIQTPVLRIAALQFAAAALLIVVALLPATVRTAPAVATENRVQGEYITGNSYRVRWVADATGFHANVVFIGDNGATASPPSPSASPLAVRPTGAGIRDIVPAPAPQEDYYDDEDDAGVDVNFKPPVVMSSRPSKLQDGDGIGCAIRNSLCGK